jgi:hypothetical protein
MNQADIFFSGKFPQVMNDFVLVIKLFEPALASEESSGGHGHHELEVVDDDLLHVVDVDGTIH